MRRRTGEARFGIGSAELPREEPEEHRDERERESLRDALQPGHAYGATMKTGVPVVTRLYSHSASAICIRMHPWETEYPIDAASGVP